MSMWELEIRESAKSLLLTQMLRLNSLCSSCAIVAWARVLGKRMEQRRHSKDIVPIPWFAAVEVDHVHFARLKFMLEEAGLPDFWSTFIYAWKLDLTNPFIQRVVDAQAMLSSRKVTGIVINPENIAFLSTEYKKPGRLP